MTLERAKDIPTILVGQALPFLIFQKLYSFWEALAKPLHIALLVHFVTATLQSTWSLQAGTSGGNTFPQPRGGGGQEGPSERPAQGPKVELQKCGRRFRLDF